MPMMGIPSTICFPLCTCETITVALTSMCTIILIIILHTGSSLSGNHTGGIRSFILLDDGSRKTLMDRELIQ